MASRGNSRSKLTVFSTQGWLLCLLAFVLISPTSISVCKAFWRSVSAVLQSMEVEQGRRAVTVGFRLSMCIIFLFRIAVLKNSQFPTDSSKGLLYLALRLSGLLYISLRSLMYETRRKEMLSYYDKERAYRFLMLTSRFPMTHAVTKTVNIPAVMVRGLRRLSQNEWS